MQQIGPELFGWLTVIAGFAALALLLHRREARLAMRIAREKAKAQLLDAASQSASAREWRLITDAALQELARASELGPMQVEAANQVDAAEHAFNRLAVELGKVGCKVVAPTIGAARQLAHEQAAEPQSQPLAA